MAKERKPRARTRPRGTPTHVISVPLRPSLKALSVVTMRLEAGRRAYNACLGHAIARKEAMRADPDFEKAKALPRGKPGSPEAKARRDAFRALGDKHGFNETALMSYGSGLRQAWVRDHVGAQEAQVLGRRAYLATQRWDLGLGGKPRFKSAGRGLRSLEVKDGCGDIKAVVEECRVIGVKVAGLHIDLAPLPGQPSSRKDREASVERERLEVAIAFGGLRSVRVVRSIVKGRPALRAQCVVDGRPPLRHKVGKGTVSVDVGPSILSVVAADANGAPVPEAIGHYELAKEVEDRSKQLRRLQRHLDRQHRAGSPECYDDKRRHKSTCVWWKATSKAALKAKADIAEAHRKIAAARKTSHGRTTNGLLAYGANVRAEKANYTAWQKTFPRSVRDRAVGQAMRELSRKAENAGGTAYPYATRTTALSQTCACGHREKKPLSQRWHRCPNCGRGAQRDLFSAFLGLHVRPVEGTSGAIADLLDLKGASEDWDAFAPYLQEAGGLSRPSSTNHRGRRPCSQRSLARTKARRKAKANSATEVVGSNSEKP